LGQLLHVLGLVADRRIELARAVIENLGYELVHYGQILNANRTYYLTRSQPPFLSSMLRAVHEQDPSQEGRGWVRGLLPTVIEEYERVWTSGPRRTGVCREGTCLSRYHGAGVGPPPEVEPGHFDWLYTPRARAAGLSVAEYEARTRPLAASGRSSAHLRRRLRSRFSLPCASPGTTPP
jgi:alpha,alpha-trehalase